MTVTLPPFVTTPVDQIPSIVEEVRQTFWTGKARDVQFRKQQLRKMYWAIEDNKNEILEACKKDLGKGFFEAMIAEVAWVQNDIIFMTNNLDKWCKDEKAENISFTNKFVSPRIRKDPLGLVLVIGYALTMLMNHELS
jgi:beta-apo-4'-carotenal oxygenase